MSDGWISLRVEDKASRRGGEKRVGLLGHWERLAVRRKLA